MIEWSMARRISLHPSDVRGYSRLVVAAVTGLTDMVEAMHNNIATTVGLFGVPMFGPTQEVARLVYQSISGVTWLAGMGVDAVLAQLTPLAGEKSTTRGHEAVRSALNGVMGDYLAATKNPLAIPMQLHHNGQALALNRSGLASVLPHASGKVLLLVHGLCMNHLQWQRHGHDHGQQLAHDLGYTPLYLHYNTGMHISTNGQALAEMLEKLAAAWPVPITELAIVAHSMGGLVTHSAWYYATQRGHTWPTRLRKLVFLGSPHHGAPLERGGQWFNLLLGITPYTAPLARLGNIRSAGITDLRHGNRLDEDWDGHDRLRKPGDRRHPLPLPAGVDCYTVAACRSRKTLARCNPLIGDGLVPVSSALGQHRSPDLRLDFPKSHQWVGYEMNHFDVLNRPEVYAKLHHWLKS